MYKKTRSEGFGPEVKRRIMLGSFVLSSGYYDAYYLKALRTKALIKKAFDRAFEKYDIILSPAAPTTAPKIGDSLSDPIKMYLGDIYTISVNLAGLPGMTIPCGMDDKGLPIGLQLIGDCFKEKNIIRAAYTYEQSAKGGERSWQNSMKPSLDLRYMWNWRQRQRFSVDALPHLAVHQIPIPARSVPVCRVLFRC